MNLVGPFHTGEAPRRASQAVFHAEVSLSAHMFFPNLCGFDARSVVPVLHASRVTLFLVSRQVP